MDSKECNKTVDEGISKFAFERVEALNERTIKRLWKVILILLALLTAAIVSFVIAINRINDKWLNLISQYDFESYEYEQDGGGINIIGDDNKEVRMYGSESESAEDDQKDRRNRQDEAGKN